MAEVTAFEFDTSGRAKARDPAGLDVNATAAGGFVWVNVNATGAGGRGWLEAAGLDPISLAALSADETRPRCTVHGDIALMNLRGVNLNPGAEPEDMVAVRLYVSRGLVITVQRRALSALDDLVEAVGSGQGPGSPGELVARLALRLADRAEPVVAALNERIDALEDHVAELAGSPAGLRGELADVRRVSILLRRYLFPQRDALSTFEIEDLGWLAQHDRSRLREAAERVTRLAEELDAIRDRAQVVHDQIMDMRAERMNRQMLVLSVVAAVFLPLGLITGLLGINVGGIPGAASPHAFWAVCGLLALVIAFQIWLFRRMGLLRF